MACKNQTRVQPVRYNLRSHDAASKCRIKLYMPDWPVREGDTMAEKVAITVKHEFCHL